MTGLLTGTVELPDGTRLRGRGLRRPTPPGPAPDFALYLGTAWLRRRHEARLVWPHAWLTWPDFLLPLDWGSARRAIVSLHERARSEQVEVACNGGIGRTGTVIACMVTLGGMPAQEAIRWTRAHHHPRAVETPWQQRWVNWFAK